jgi:CRISPR/Cas system type I-B associated protein Csh2 (Cas7 group RAMP superfamily)
MINIERARVFQQQAMAVDIEIAVAQTGGGITEDQGQAAMNAAWPYVEKAIQSERARGKVLVEALRWYSHKSALARLIHGGGDEGRNAISTAGGTMAQTALAAYGDGHE